mmetsp:Transcript_82050/g.171750  ORF Transcript_82050/g.171750 Transcript_82050/m.171750 type:complete len:380 (+) Transcript_82050:56-1195(+)
MAEARGSVSSGLAPQPVDLVVFKESNGYGVGDRVWATNGSKVRIAYVKFIGETQFEKGVWIGLELETPDGKNNGSVKGVKYFECVDKHGIFLKPDKVKLAKDSEDPPAASPAPKSKAKAKAGVNFSKSDSVVAVPAAKKERGSVQLELKEGLTVPFMGTAATIRYLGPLVKELPGEEAVEEGAHGPYWVGLEMQESLGRSDGTFCGHRYFHCEQGRALFAQAPSDNALHSLALASLQHTSSSSGAGADRPRFRTRASTVGEGEILVHSDDEGNPELHFDGLTQEDQMKLQFFFDEFSRQLEEKERLEEANLELKKHEEKLRTDLRSALALHNQDKPMNGIQAEKAPNDPVEVLDLTSKRRSMFDTDLSRFMRPRPSSSE